MATYEEFGELKNEYSHPRNFTIRETLIPLMRKNLIARNNGKLEVVRYGSDEIIDLENCNLQDLYAADMAIRLCTSN